MSSAAHRLLAAREKVTRILCKKIIMSKRVVLVHIDGSKVFEIYIYAITGFAETVRGVVSGSFTLNNNPSLQTIFFTK